MFSKAQVWILAGAVLLACGVAAIYEFWPGAASQQTMASASGSPTDTGPASDANGDTAAPDSRPNVPETPLPDVYFKLTGNSHNLVEGTNGNQSIEADLEMKYTHQKTKGGSLLTLYSMELKLSQEGAPTEYTLMTRDKIVQQVGAQKVETAFADEPPEQQAAMAAAFATNLCKIILDADQNELGRQVFSDIGYAAINDGNVNSLQLMHGPYHVGADQWEGIKRIPMTRGLILDCPLKYQRAGGSANEINISGTLSKSEVDSPLADIAIKNVFCGLSGQETYDEALGEYTSGKMTLQYKFQSFQNGAQIATFSGELELTLERVTRN